MRAKKTSQRAAEITKIIRDKAKRFGVKLEQLGNAGNHIHLLVKFTTREGFQNFLRSITGLIARLVTKAQKGKALAEKFWDQLAYSRIVERGREFFTVKRYVELNDIEGAGGSMTRAKQADIWAYERKRTARRRQN